MYRYSHTIGMLSLACRGFSNPLDLAIGPDALLYVINRSNFHQETISVRVSVCSAEGEFRGQFSRFGMAEGELTWPTAIIADGKGGVYVADEHRHNVQVFSADGKYLRNWGGQGAHCGKLNRPSGLAMTADGGILVSDQLNNRIQKFSPEGEFLLETGSGDCGPGELKLPWGVATDEESRIYVADWGNDRVQVYTSDGRHIRSFGSSGLGVGQLRRPAGLAVDGERVYVADWGNDRVQVYTLNGSVVTTLYGDADLSLRAREWLADSPEMLARRQGADSDQEKRFWGPTGVRVDEQGRVFVADSCRHRVQVYQRDG